MKRIIIAAALFAVVFSGCAARQGQEYDARSYQQIKRYSIGTVVEARPVVISDSGSGTFIGALVGAVLGSTVGRGSGKTLATLGGGLAGAYVGQEAGKANASELTVALDNGGDIVVVVKGQEQFLPGDRVKIIQDGNRADRVERIPSQPYGY